MKFSESNVSIPVEILKRKLGGELFEEITLNSEAFTSGVCKAGTPIDADGKIDNKSASPTPKGILLYDVYSDNPNGTIVRAFACVNEAKANANAGIEIAAAVKAALPLIVFE